MVPSLAARTACTTTTRRSIGSAELSQVSPSANDPPSGSSTEFGALGLAALTVTSGVSDDDQSKSISEAPTPTTVVDGSVGSGDLEDVVIEMDRAPGCGGRNSRVEYLRAHGANMRVDDDSDRDSPGMVGDAADWALLPVIAVASDGCCAQSNRANGRRVFAGIAVIDGRDSEASTVQAVRTGG